MPLLPPREMKMSSAEPSVRTKWGRCWGAVRAPRIPGQQRPLLECSQHQPLPSCLLGWQVASLTPHPQKCRRGHGAGRQWLGELATGERAGSCLNPTAMVFLDSQRESSTQAHSCLLMGKPSTLGRTSTRLHRATGTLLWQPRTLSRASVSRASRLLGLPPAQSKGDSGNTGRHFW